MTSVAAAAAGPARSLDMPAILKESLIAAGVAFLLLVVMVGLHTIDTGRGLGLETRFFDVGMAVVLVFLGRLGFALTRDGWPLPAVLGGTLVAGIGLYLATIAETLRSQGVIVPTPTGFLQFVTVAGGVVIALRASWRISPYLFLAVACGGLAVMSWRSGVPASWVEAMVRDQGLFPGLAAPDVASGIGFGVRIVVAGALAVIGLVGLVRWFTRPASVAAGSQDGEKSAGQAGRPVSGATRLVGPLAALFALALPVLFYDRSTIDLGILVLTYVMLGWGLNIIVGLAGLLDLGYVAFYAVGAYSYAILATTPGLEFSFWLSLPLAGVLASSFGLMLGFPVLRLRGDYFAIVTLGFGEIIRIILTNWASFTGGPNGIASIPRPSFFGLAEFTSLPGPGEVAFHTFINNVVGFLNRNILDSIGLPIGIHLQYSSLHRVVFLYYLILVLALIVNLFSLRIRRLPIGRAWEALREDDIACQALGINRRNVKLAAFGISAMFGGFAGAFFSTRQGFISPESFTFLESAIILAIVVLGGMGSQAGVALAAVLVIGMPELFRELEQYRMLAFGAAMVGIMIWRPRGLLAHREPTVRLNDPPRRRRGDPSSRQPEPAMGEVASS